MAAHNICHDLCECEAERLSILSGKADAERHVSKNADIKATVAIDFLAEVLLKSSSSGMSVAPPWGAIDWALFKGMSLLFPLSPSLLPASQVCKQLSRRRLKRDGRDFCRLRTHSAAV